MKLSPSPVSSGSHSVSADRPSTAIPNALPALRRRAFTLVEAMVALFILALGLMAFLGSFIQSRRVTESSVLHAAATSLVYGLLEQIKGLDYDSVPSSDTPPVIDLRISQDQSNRSIPLQVVYTSNGTSAPLTTPAADATATSVGAIDNVIGPLPLSSTSGTQSQQLALTLWIWVDALVPDATRDVKEVKKITVVYTYSYNDGAVVRTVRDREVIIRTRFDQ